MARQQNDHLGTVVFSITVEALKEILEDLKDTDILYCESPSLFVAEENHRDFWEYERIGEIDLAHEEYNTDKPTVYDYYHNQIRKVNP